LYLNDGSVHILIFDHVFKDEAIFLAIIDKQFS